MRRPCASHWQFHGLGHLCQLLFPVGELLDKVSLLQQLLLPQCEISILERHVRQWRGLTIGESFVQTAQLGYEHSERPAISDDVMHCQEQKRFLWCQTK